MGHLVGERCVCVCVCRLFTLYVLVVHELYHETAKGGGGGVCPGYKQVKQQYYHLCLIKC